jgi:hypothetical protein
MVAVTVPNAEVVTLVVQLAGVEKLAVGPEVCAQAHEIGFPELVLPLASRGSGIPTVEATM